MHFSGEQNTYFDRGQACDSLSNQLAQEREHWGTVKNDNS